MVDSSQQNSNNEVSMPKTKKNVDNKMGRWGATSYIVGNIVGAGIFVSPTSITNQVNSVGMSLAIWVLSAAICTMGGFCYLELGNSVNQSGGDFAYLCFVKWRCIAFAFMATGCILVYPMQLAIAAGAAGDYLFQSFGSGWGSHMQADSFWLRKLLGFCIVWPILFLNFFSVRRVVAPFQIASSISKLIACGLIIGAGIYLIIFRGHTQNFHRPFQNSTWEAGHITNALFAGFYSYDGWDILNWGNEEIQDPKRTMSFAMLGGMGCVTLLYTAMNVAYFAVLTPEEMRSTDAVAMSFAENLIGPATAQWTIPLLINLVLLGSINGTMFIASRYLFAAAREGQLPSFLACINERNESPRAALFVHVLLAFLFSFFGNTDQLITSMGFAQWLQRCFTMAALLYIRLSDLPVHSNSMRTPLLLPLLFMAICIGLVFVTVFQEFSNASIGLIVLAMAGLAYPIFLWEKGLPRFEPYRKWANWLNGKNWTKFWMHSKRPRTISTNAMKANASMCNSS